ncbi:MAG: peptidoglycan recognition family protein [Lachnospiraceae bacterium]|nr:peptidoglycan recognition family protein [Lachnospiraceae bacterium]
MIGCIIVLFLTVCGLFIQSCMRRGRVSPYGKADPAYDDGRPYIDVQLLTPNPYSRPTIPTDPIKGIVIHYVGNPGSTAQSNRDYFEGLKDSKVTSASSNFIVGLEGEIIQCVPTNEIAYCSNSRNSDTVSIEVCHETADGKFNESTYSSLVNLTGWLCMYLDVSPKEIIRHYDITGKICPKYYVEHEDAWETFIDDVKVWIQTEKSRE